jgi:hypothetical protein
LEGINDSRGQRVFRTHHNKIDIFVAAKADAGGEIHGIERYGHDFAARASNSSGIARPYEDTLAAIRAR